MDRGIVVVTTDMANEYVFPLPDRDYSCGAAYCDDPCCNAHGAKDGDGELIYWQGEAMANKTKTALEILLETAAGFYRALTELDNVAAPHGSELQREAHKLTGLIQKALDSELAAWNQELGDDDLPLNPAIALCAGVESWEPWAKRDKCDVYIVASGGPMCQSCTALKARWDAEELADARR